MTLIFRLKKSNNSGFTLVELMVVVALIALITSLALPSLSGFFRISVNSITREMASVIREAYNSTMITGRVHRLAMDFKENQYWVEAGPRTHLLHTKETLEIAERQTRWFGAEKKISPFSISTTITKKKIDLPSDVKFKEILTQRDDEPVSDGTAYVHFFPNGITEQSIIIIEDDSKNNVSLIVSALVGKTTVENRAVSKEEAFDVR